jgi:eukaryotic-like serine/threonine-protein kinase
VSATTPEPFGSYMVYERLGIGGMATVHVAETRSAGGFRKRVALKRLHPHVAHQEELVDAFVQEARLARYLHHANIAQTFDFGEVDDTYFIAMELVAGPTLGQLVRQCQTTIGVIPFPVSMNILMQVCDALDYAHNLRDESGTPLGIIHRDVSPPNIIVSNTGLVKLIDFGLAKAKTAVQKTQVGTLKGKLRYIAPEYLSGKLDRRADIWAVGAIAYEMLTAQQLFDGEDDVDVLARVRRMEIPPPSRINPDVPPELDAVVLRALQRDPQRRYQAAGAMKVDLLNVAAVLQTIVTNNQLKEWAEWAFSQEPPDEHSELSRLIDVLTFGSKPAVRRALTPPMGTGDGAWTSKLALDESRIFNEDNIDTDPVPKQRAEATPLSSTLDQLDRESNPQLVRRPVAAPVIGGTMLQRNRSTARWLIYTILIAFLGSALYLASYFGLITRFLGAGSH